MDLTTLDQAIHRVQRHLLKVQHADGHWCGELQISTITESLYIVLQAILGKLDDPCVGKLARYIAGQQNADGGWSVYPGGPADVSLSVESYFALKLAGRDPASEPLVRAREKILELGGAGSVMSFRRFFLAALGQIPYSHCVSVPPELMLLPNRFPLSIYRMSSWTRPWIVGVSILNAYRPVTHLPPGLGIEELFVSSPDNGPRLRALRTGSLLLSWANAFRVLDSLVKACDKIAPRYVRLQAISEAKKHWLPRSDSNVGLPSLFFSMLFSILALRCLGYPDDAAEIRGTERLLKELFIEEDDTIRIQPCFSPVWDTAWSIVALAESGVPPDDPALTRAADWLLAREIRQRGDWAEYRPDLEPSGWAFQYTNPFYPDLDDTALVLVAFRRTCRYGEEAYQRSAHRALNFLKGMQSSDHGWAAFDPDINNHVLEHLPFADHNAILDPSCADVTGRVLEMLALYGYRADMPFIKGVSDFLFGIQEPEGCWYGRWGVNYIYGTWQAITGLTSIGHDPADRRIRRAVEWLKSVQHPSGGWGESAASYTDRSMMGTGEPSPSQTAWAVMGLIAAGEANSPEARRGILYLIDTQKSQGDWEERCFVGTGFPDVIYLRYDFYRIYFPLLALARYRKAFANAR